MSATTSARRAALAAAALASVFLLAACAPGTSSVEHYPGLPVIEHPVEQDEPVDPADEEAEEEHEPEPEGPLAAIWLEQGGKLAVTVWGSSTCPPIGEHISVVSPAGEGNTVSISLKDYGDGICTADFVPHTTVFWTPQNVATTEPLTVQAGGDEVVVPVK